MHLCSWAFFCLQTYPFKFKTLNDIEHLYKILQTCSAISQNQDRVLTVQFGFRGGNEFWFTQHNEPFNIKLPEGKGLDGQGIYRIATGLDSDISFTQEACDLLTVVPAPFVEAALSVFVKKAKEQNITEVDANFIKTADTRWSGKKS